MNKRAAGRLGGMVTKALYGADHYRRIGRLGQKRLKEKYRLMPCLLAEWCLVDRLTNQIVKIW